MTVIIIVIIKRRPRRGLPSLSRKALIFGLLKVLGPTHDPPYVPLSPEKALLSVAGRSCFKEPQVKRTEPDLKL